MTAPLAAQAPPPPRYIDVPSSHPEWPAVRAFLVKVFADPLQRWNTLEAVKMQRRVYDILLSKDEAAWRECGLDVIPLEGEGCRMRNTVVTWRRVAAVLAEHCNRIGQRIAFTPHTMGKAQLCVESFEMYELSTKLARNFALSAVDTVVLAHAKHEASHDNCYCTQRDAVFSKTRVALHVIAECYRVCVFERPDNRRGLEHFMTDALVAMWNDEAAGPDPLLVRLAMVARKVGSEQWFRDVVCDRYEDFVHSALIGAQGSAPAELCVFLAKRFREDFITAVKWLDPITLGAMQLIAARMVEAAFSTLLRDAESWLQTGDREKLRCLHYLFMLQAAKMHNVVWLESNVRTAAARHLERELLSATGCAPSEIHKPQQLQKPQLVVDAIFDWKDHYDSLLHDAFHDDPKIAAALRGAANAALKKCAVILAFVVHSCMIAKAPVERTIDLFSFVFPALDERDVCVANTVTFLESRLLQPGADVESERELVTAIRGTLEDPVAARRLEAMVSDILSSAALQPAIDEQVAKLAAKAGAKLGAASKKDRALEPVPVAVAVLSANSWSVGGAGRDRGIARLPPEFEASMAAVEAAYRGLHSARRRLEWLHARSSVVVRSACFHRMQMEIQAPLALFMTFNAFDAHNSDSVSLEAALGGLQASSSVIANIDRLVQIGFITSSEPLQDAAKRGEAPAGVTLTINRAFTAKMRKFNLLPRPTIATATTIDSTVVKGDRDSVIQAVIVRVLKSRRRVSHTDLLQAVVEVLRVRFIPTVPAMKRAIETLIEKEYLVRATDVPDTYDYLA